MVERYFAGVVPRGTPNNVDADDEKDLEAYHASIGGPKGFLLHDALKAVWQTVARANEYVDKQAPWKLAKNPESRAELEQTLATVVRQLARQAVYLWPFMPKKSEELWASLGAPGTPLKVGFHGIKAPDPTGWRVKKGVSLFPKSDTVQATGS
jgi:methionyl-tRNA synthetase